MFKCCRPQEVGWFDKEENSSGALSSRLSADTAAIRGALGDQVIQILQAIPGNTLQRILESQPSSCSLWEAPLLAALHVAPAMQVGYSPLRGMWTCVQVGLLVQNLVTFAVAYLIAFSSGWKMTLVVTASIPLMVIAGGIQASVMTGFSSKVNTLLQTLPQ